MTSFQIHCTEWYYTVCFDSDSDNSKANSMNDYNNAFDVVILINKIVSEPCSMMTQPLSKNYPNSSLTSTSTNLHYAIC